jgi:hypothetical protein
MFGTNEIVGQKFFKELAIRAGFVVTRNMEGPADLICGSCIQAVTAKVM